MSDMKDKLVKLSSLKLVNDILVERIDNTDGDLETHIADENVHITMADRQKINDSISVTYNDEMLVFEK